MRNCCHTPLRRRAAGVLFPVTLVTIAGYKVSLRTITRFESAGTAPFEKAGETLRFCSPRLLFRSRLMKLSYECRVSGAAECLRCQFAGFAPLRSALHSYRTFTTRGHYLLTGAPAFCSPWL